MSASVGWAVRERSASWLAERVVFLSGGESDDAGNVAPGRPMFRKGQDSAALRAVLREIIRQKRHETSSAMITVTRE